MKTYYLAMFVALCLIATSNAQTTVTTEFTEGPGSPFITGSTADVTLDGLVTFSGGQQRDGFLGAAYNNGPAAYLFINGGGGFNGAASTGDTGSILFGGGGATSVSFHAADLANGAATAFTAIGIDGSNLGTQLTQVSSLSGTDPLEILSFSSIGGINIDRIEVDLPGPNANPPYAASIDTFSATIAAAVPEPSSIALLSLATSCTLLRRRR
jgi:hypothetical protein